MCSMDSNRDYEHHEIPRQLEVIKFPMKRSRSFLGLFSLAPQVTQIAEGDDAKKALVRAFEKEVGFDFVVIDHLAASWALKHITPENKVLYFSHNDEFLVRESIARHSRFPMSFMHWLDSKKVKWRLKEMLDRTFANSCISQNDLETISNEHPGRTFHLIHPRWFGATPSFVELDNAGRRVCLLGSFLWSAKKMNLEKFLSRVYSGFVDQRIELAIIGRIDSRFQYQLERQYPELIVTGEVECLESELARCRAGVIFGKAGGGFRMTLLTYLAHGVPIISTANHVSDLKLQSGKSYIEYSSESDVPYLIGSHIENLSYLNEVRREAFAANEVYFDVSSFDRDVEHWTLDSECSRRC